MGLFSKDVGIDLGTANTLVYMKGKGIIMREPSVVAVDTKTDEVRCVGAEAKAVIGRTPGSIVAVRPLKDGVIADFDITTNMLENFLKKACGNSMFSRPRVVICIPSGVTEVERRAVREATLKAGARQVSVIEEPMAAAIGAGLPISEPTGSMIVDIGGGTAEIAVISLGGIVASRSVRMAGDMFDQAIIAFIKRKYNLLIGERTAEQIKIEIGSAYALDPEMTMEIKGRNLVDGLPKNIVVHSEDVREALLECLVKITSAIKETLERTPKINLKNVLGRYNVNTISVNYVKTVINSVLDDMTSTSYQYIGPILTGAELLSVETEGDKIKPTVHIEIPYPVNGVDVTLQV